MNTSNANWFAACLIIAIFTILGNELDMKPTIPTDHKCVRSSLLVSHNFVGKVRNCVEMNFMSDSENKSSDTELLIFSRVSKSAQRGKSDENHC